MSTPAPAATPASKRKTRKPPGSETSPPDPRPEPPAPAGNAILPLLGLHGLDDVEPVILASLVTEDPLLLIGAHGTGKSMLLGRLAEALGLCFRHYNASLICFDDLIGFPMPEKDSNTLRYLQTPATIWDAEAVLFDEVSRCKPDVQNKLFSIIHERKVQGLSLERLRYRWSAMNPPSSSGGMHHYAGSIPLDSALADRYAFIVKTPDWNQISGEAQEAILSGARAEPDPAAPDRLRGLIEQTKPVWRSLSNQFAPLLTEYVRAVAALLKEADIRLSIRRLAMLMRNIPAVHAVRTLLLDGKADARESAWLALSCSVPHEAEGLPLPKPKLRAAHEEAWKSAAEGKCSELVKILAEPNLVRRLILAVRNDNISLQERSLIVADCLNALPAGSRLRVAMWLMENDLAGRLLAAVAESIAEDYSCLVNGPKLTEYKAPAGGWSSHASEEIRSWLSRLAPDDREGAALARYLVDKAARDVFQSRSEAGQTIASWESTSALLKQLEQGSE